MDTITSKQLYNLITSGKMDVTLITNKKCKYTFGNNVHVILLKNKIKNGKLANYLLINGESKRYGNYGSLVAYLKSQKILNKKE